jgi:hypothetical protein
VSDEEKVAKAELAPGESLLFIQRGAVMTAVLDPTSGTPVPVDQFGTSRGWLAVTSMRRLLYGYFGFLGRAKRGGARHIAFWRGDPRGVSFGLEGPGLEDVCLFVPMTISPEVVYAVLSRNLGAEGAPVAKDRASESSDLDADWHPEPVGDTGRSWSPLPPFEMSDAIRAPIPPPSFIDPNDSESWADPFVPGDGYVFIGYRRDPAEGAVLEKLYPNLDFDVDRAIDEVVGDEHPGFSADTKSKAAMWWEEDCEVIRNRVIRQWKLKNPALAVANGLTIEPNND